MRIEIKSAANFLVELARLNSGGLDETQLERFRENVVSLLLRHYADHWFPDQPVKGSGYRCIRINGTLDPLIARAGFMMGLAMNFLRSLFPSELTMWVDPREVAYRIGENGSICVLYEQRPRSPSPSPPPMPKTPVKALPPPALHHAAHTHFSPSKSVVGGLQPSPPLSPSSTPLHHHPHHPPHPSHHHLQQQHAAAMQLSMFLVGAKEGGVGGLVKCKESVGGGLDPRPLAMDPLFVAS